MVATDRKAIGLGISIALLLATSGAVSAHDDGCTLDLRAAPIEAVPPQPGWAWREVELTADGWQGRLEWSGGDIRAASFEIACALDPAGLFERRAQVRSSLWAEDSEPETAIGDETVAYRLSTTGTTHLEWRDGSVVGEIVGEWNASLRELEAMAAAFDAALGPT